MKKILFGALCCVCLLQVNAQDATVVKQTAPATKKEYVYKMAQTPQHIDNYLFATYYSNGEKTYNIRNVELATSDGVIKDLRINPSGTSYTILSKDGYKSKIAVYDLWKVDTRLFRFKNLENASAICYTPDAKSLLIATPTKLQIHEARKKYLLQDTMPLLYAPTKMIMSNNGNYLVATDGRKVTVWNFEEKKVRKEFDLGVAVNDVAFSNDNSTFAILTADGLLSTYDTRNFLIKQTFESLGEAIACAFHPEDKYIAIISGGSRITMLNMLDDQDRTYIDNDENGIFDVRFLKDNNKRIFLIYNTTANLIFRLASELTPHYNKLLADELNYRMNEWLKMQPGETLEEYNTRVNDETRANQKRLFEEEIATRLADNMLEMSQMSLGSYNTETNMLAVNFDSMPTIYLNVPESDVTEFTSIDNLEFTETMYGLTSNDKFEMVYAKVYNKTTGKSYVFDNRSRKTLDYLKSDENFVPLELIQQSNMEAMKLEEIKEEVIDVAKKESIISDHTNIAVNAEVVPAQDADGNNIMNYKIDFGYEVEPQFSAQEDFAPGKYKVEESGAATSMLTIVKNAFENDFAKYVVEGKKLQVNITGMADALAINRKIPYDGCYGDIEDEPVYKNGDLSSVTVTPKTGIRENEQLAFLRAFGVKEYIENNVDALNKMNTNYRYNIELAEGKGGAYRRITVEFIFVDAF